VTAITGYVEKQVQKGNNLLILEILPMEQGY
jgi:hypothetical protein